MPGWCWRRGRWPRNTLVARCRRRPVKTALYRSYKAAEIAGKPIKITNTGDAAVQAVVSVTGAPITPEPAASNGFKIERNYFTLDGKPADRRRPSRMTASRSCSRSPKPSRNTVTSWWSDYLPAGFEIDNPRLVSSGDTGTLDWIEDGQEPVNTAFRDDRFNAAIDRAAMTSRCLRWPMSCARCRRANMCCRRPMSRTCTIPRAMAAPAPARSRCVRRNERLADHSAGRPARLARSSDAGGRDCGCRGPAS